MSWVITRLSFREEIILVKLAMIKSTFYTKSFRKHPLQESPSPETFNICPSSEQNKYCTRTSHGVLGVSTRSQHPSGQGGYKDAATAKAVEPRQAQGSTEPRL